MNAPFSCDGKALVDGSLKALALSQAMRDLEPEKETRKMVEFCKVGWMVWPSWLLPPGTAASRIRMLVRVPTAQLLIQLPACAPWEAVRAFLAPTWEVWM